MDLAELRHIWLFDGLDDAQVQQIVDAADEVTFADGDVLFVQGEPAEHWWVLLEGRVALARRAGHAEEVVNQMERPGVWAGGFEAWSEGVGYLTTGTGRAPGRFLRLPSATLGELTEAWFPFAVHFVRAMFQTVRMIETTARERDALVALGEVAAGFAHELNNPAGAATRAADALDESCSALLGSLVLLAERSLRPEEFLAIEELRRELVGRAPLGDPVDLADREDALVEWLEDHDVADAWRIAPALAPVVADAGWCDRAAATLDAETLGPALAWIAGTVSTRSLLDEVREATGRVSNLVGAVKSYSQLDRAPVQVIDVTEGIESTLTILGQKLHGITIERAYEPDLPRIEAIAAELNQVWTNLVENAVDAMDGLGTLRLTVRSAPDGVVVGIGDTGPGMPPEVQARAFEPFFTTKDVTKGTGLGLDISRRIVVERHRGTITIDAGSSGTTMWVALPRRHAE
jgi:signal transduction histidine kinase